MNLICRFFIIYFPCCCGSLWLLIIEKPVLAGSLMYFVEFRAALRGKCRELEAHHGLSADGTDGFLGGV